MFQILLGGTVAIHFIYCLFLVQKVALPGTFLRFFDNHQSSDAKKIITRACYAHKYNSVIEYDMSFVNDQFRLVYSENLGYSFLEKLKAKTKKESYFFDTKFSYKTHGNQMSMNVFKRVRFRCTTTKSFLIPSPDANIMIDGLNKDNYAVIGCTNHIDSILFIIRANQESLYDDLHVDASINEKPINKLLSNDVTAVMIHPIKNSIAYANTKKNDVNTLQHEIHIVENAYPEEYSYFTSIFSNKIIEKCSIDYCVPVSCEIKKITFFGGNTYIFLTSFGQLGMFWLTKNETEHNAIEWSLKKHISTFIDFAPDMTRVTKSGFTPYWVFLNDQGELFECDFLAQSIKPTLNFIKKVPTPNAGECFDKLYFNNKKCGVLYKNTDKELKTSYKKIILYS